MFRHKRFVLLMISIGVLLLCAKTVNAQVTTATIYGSVTDASGSTVPGATVTITNQQTSATQNTKTNESGEFTFEFLQVGTYTLSITAPGFKENSQPNIELSGGQRIRLNYALSVGEVSEKVTISADAPLINAVNSEQQFSHDTVEVRELPLPRRDWTNLVTVGTGMDVRTSGTGTGVAVNGLPPGGLSLTVDGTQASASSEGTSLTQFGNFNLIKVVSLEAIAEVNVTKNILSAEHANSLSGNVGLITKNGTNDFHGSLFENYIGRVLNARPQFLATRPNEVFNQFGGSIGGPIIKNKLFFFGVYEGYRQRRFSVLNDNVPTAEFRAKAIAAVPAYKAFFDTFPLPNQPYAAGAQTGAYIAPAPQRANDNHFVVRGDYNINDMNRISSRYTHGKPDSLTFSNSVLPFIFNGLNDAFTTSFFHVGKAYSSETRFGYNNNDVSRLIGVNAENGGIPAIGGLTFPAGGSELLASRGKAFSIEEIIAFDRGNHSFKFGGIYQNQHQTRVNNEAPQANYGSEADLLANNPTSVQVGFGVDPYVIRDFSTGFFIQDDYRFRPNLILNLGLRYDYFNVPSERDNRLFNRNGPTGLGSLRTPQEGVYNSDKNNFAPRVSLAWTVDKDAKTVVRTGFGIFYSRAPLFNVIDTIRNSASLPFRIVFSRAEAQALGFKYPTTPDTARAAATNPNAPWTGTAINPDFPTPYSMQWTLGVQRQLTKTMALDVAYVGTRGVHLVFDRLINSVNRVTGLRPFAGFGEFRYFDSSESTTYHALQMSLQKRLSRDLMYNVNYTWSRSMSYGIGDVASLIPPQDPNNLRLEKGPSPFDVPHRFSADFLYELPFARYWGEDSLAKRLAFKGWQFSGIFIAQSGYPFSVAMPNSILGQRVDYVGGSPYLDNSSNRVQYLNPAAFARVPVIAASGAASRPGTLGRNALRLPSIWNLDFSIAKNLVLTERVRMQLRADMINAFNHTNFTTINTTITAANFGRFTGTSGARVVQVNMRFTF